MIRIGVIGDARCDAATAKVAEEVGAWIAKRGAALVCGGLGGVMEAAAHGAKKNNGLTIGILPGKNSDDANQFIELPIVTGMGEARNAMVVRSSQAVIAVGGGYGTLSEIAFALKWEIPVIGLATWELRKERYPDRIIRVKTPQEAVEKALASIQKR